MGYAKATLLGNLTRDPETKFTPNGKPVTSFGMAINRKGAGGRESVAFIDVAMWGPRGEAFAKFHQKGSLAFVSGDLEMDTWEDKRTGEKKSKLKVTAWDWDFVGGRESGSQAAPARQADPFTDQVGSAFSAETDPDDGIPF